MTWLWYNADFGPLDHALPPSEGPVHVFHTFVRFLFSALCILILVFAIGFQETLDEKEDQLFHFSDIDDLSSMIEIQASAVIAECLCAENSENCNVSETQTLPETFQVEKGMVRKI